MRIEPYLQRFVEVNLMGRKVPYDERIARLKEQGFHFLICTSSLRQRHEHSNLLGIAKVEVGRCSVGGEDY